MLHPGLKRYPYILVLVLLFGMQAAQAHRLSPPVKGVVTDAYGHPLAGVRIALKGGSRFVVSNGDGVFRIDAGEGATLVFTHPAFNVTEVKVAKVKGNVAIRLSERALQGRPFMVNTEIGGRIVPVQDSEKAETESHQGDTIALPAAPGDKIDVLYGQQSKESFLGSIATIGGNEISTTPASSYLYAMQGRLAGVDMNQVQGFSSFSTSLITSANSILGLNVPSSFGAEGPTDNSEFNITIRGHGQSLGQNPIAIVDGVQRELYSIDPESIKSISVLKDPLSTLLLGQNSSRGAIIVTTKEPEVGATRLTVSAESGTQTALGLPTPLPAYRYAYLLNEALANNGLSAVYTEADFNAYRNHTDPIGHPDVNWYKTILQPDPLMTRVNLNAAGGSPVARYVMNLSYLNQNGMFVNSPTNNYNTNLQLQRYVLNSKIDVDVNKDFAIKLQLFGRLQDGNEPGGYNEGASGSSPSALGGGWTTILQNLLSTPNNAYPVYNPNGSFGGNSAYGQNLLAETTGAGYIQDHLHDVLSNLNLHYKLDKVTKGLWVNASGDVSVQSEATINRTLETPVFQTAISSGDTAYHGYGYTVPQTNGYNSTSWARYRFFQFTAGYDRKFGPSSFSAEVLGDQKRELIDYDVPSELTNIGAKASYNWNEKYFAEAAVDYSGYNRYQPGHQFGLFYAGGLGWDVTKEEFFKDLFPWVDHFKLRATYGLTGNANVDDYGYFIWREQYQSQYGSYNFGNTYNDGYNGNNSEYEGGVPGSQVLNNANATWERADKFDGGTDLAFLHNTLLFTADYYRERYFDVMQVPGDNIELIGISYPAENLGVDLYQGAEVTLTYQNRLGNFNYFLTGNASVQQSKVMYMDEQYEQNQWNRMTGRPVGQPFGYIADGLFQTAAQAAAAPTIQGYTPQAGDVRYKDLNGDGTIDQFDVAPLTKGRPIISYGLNLGFNYEGVEFSAFFQGVANRYEYENNPYVNEGFVSQNNEYSQAYQQVLGRWIPEDAATANSPRLTAGGNTYNYSPNGGESSYFMQNGDYVRLKNLYLGYNLPYRLLKRAKVGGVKIFASAQNVFTYAAYKGVDPEVSLPSYPIQRVVNFGVTLKL